MHTQTRNNNWALITGASSGFGEEFARQYAAQGHSLVLVARRKDRLESLAESLRSNYQVEVIVEGVDLSDLEGVRQLHQRVQERGITIDVLINNAGYGLQGAFQDANLSDALGMVQLDIASLTAVTHLFAADMRARRSGKILLVSSLLAHVAVESFAVYAAAKAYVLRFGEALHREMQKDGITVTTLCPGLSDTGFAAAAQMHVSPLLKLLMMKPEPVVKAGIRALNAGRISVVPGLPNKFMAWFIWASPRWLHQAVFAQVMSPKPTSNIQGGKGAMNALLVAFTSAILFTLSSCVVGPDYKRPADAVPSEFKGADAGSWKKGQPTDNLPKGNWWTVFNDQALNSLQSRAAEANQQVQAAIARVDQARSAARVARSELLPQISSGSSFSRMKFSANQVPSFGGITANQFRVPLDLSYEIDLWGRVRRSAESARADAEATLAAFPGVLLILHADVAQHYFSLRALDAELLTLADTVQLRKKQLELVVKKSKGGAGNELDVTRAETALASTEAEKAGLGKRRAELENALAILVGANPSTFSFPAASGGKGQDWKPTLPSIPSGLPSDLLERRPDVAEAERQLASANARIGVAKAAFFPAVSLTGSGGSVSADFQDVFSWDSRAWSIGPSVSLPIFAGGRNLANYRRSKSGYQEAVARYRQSVLVAFGDVESSLAGIRFLAEQSAALDRVVTSSSRGAELASQRYEAGVVSYLEVVDADREALQAQRARVQLTGQRLIASVQLVKALGGSWAATH